MQLFDLLHLVDGLNYLLVHGLLVEQVDI